jgi:hypothetical protein
VGLIWGEELYLDATKMPANASVDSVQPRFAVAARAHVDDLFAIDAGAVGPQPPVLVTEAPARIGPSEEATPELGATNAARHDWVAQAGRQDRRRTWRDYVRTADHSVSTTDPDATHLPFRDGVRLGYQGHYLVDGGKARIIRGATGPRLDLAGPRSLAAAAAPGHRRQGLRHPGDHPRPGGAGSARLPRAPRL